MIRKLFNVKFNTIASAAIIIAGAGLISRFLGIVRDRVLASEFGAGDFLDIYYASFRVPDLVYNFIVLGAISAGFIPIFVALLKKDDSNKFDDNQEAWDLVSNLVNILLIFLIFVGAILAIFANKLVPLITPGFTGEKLELTINLTRIMFISPLLLGVSSIMGGVLQAQKRFLAYALAPIMYNLGIIIGALFFVKIWGLYGLAYGVIVGALLHFLIQLPVVLKLGYRYKLILKLKEKNFLKILKMTGPRILGIASTQFNLIIITIFASLLTAGSLTVFNLANNLQSFPLGIFGISFAIAAFPVFAKTYADSNFADFNLTLLKTFKQIMFFIIPFSVLFIILRMQIVRVILGAGNFDWQATILTGNSLGIFCLSLFAQALIPLLVRAFYARHNTVIPFLASFFSVFANIGITFWAVKYFDVLGLAIGFSSSAIINFIFLIVFLKIEIKQINYHSILSSLFKISIAALVAGGVTQLVKTYLGSFVDMQKFWGVFLQGVMSGCIGLLVFAWVCHIFKVEELEQFFNGFKRRFLRKVKVTNESIREIG